MLWLRVVDSSVGRCRGEWYPVTVSSVHYRPVRDRGHLAQPDSPSRRLMLKGCQLPCRRRSMRYLTSLQLARSPAPLLPPRVSNTGVAAASDGHFTHFLLCIEYKLLSLTYKVLTTSQPDYLHNQISVQPSGRTRSSSVVTLARPSVSSTLLITNRSFRYASPHLWNQLPSSFRQSHCVHSPPGSPHPAHITLSLSSSSLSPSILSLPRPFTADLKLISFTNPFLHSHSYSFRTDFTDLNLYRPTVLKGHTGVVSFSGYVS